MKKILSVVFAVMLVGLMAFGQTTTPVLSRNAVGYVKVIAERGKLVLGRVDFLPLDGSAVASNVFGNQLPNGTQILSYDPSIAAYRIDSKSFAGWSTNINFATGKGFWVKIPLTAASNAYDVFFMGEVPSSSTAPTTTLQIAQGVTQLGFPYPTEVVWTNTALAKAAKRGDQMITWDGTNYVINSLSFAGWAFPNMILTPAQGFWYKTQTPATNWQVAKPYVWP